MQKKRANANRKYFRSSKVEQTQTKKEQQKLNTRTRTFAQ